MEFEIIVSVKVKYPVLKMEFLSIQNGTPVTLFQWGLWSIATKEQHLAELCEYAEIVWEKTGIIFKQCFKAMILKDVVLRNYKNWGCVLRFCCSAATEGKRLAEQLVASFAASTDPVGDAGECLASAALWLQTMKSRMQSGGGDSAGGLATSSISGLGSSSVAAGGSLGSLRSHAPLNGVSNMLQQQQPLPYLSGPGASSNVGSPGSGGLGSLAINSGSGISHSNHLLGSSLVGRVSNNNAPPGGMGSLLGSRGIMGRPAVRFEDFKDRPSDFLRVRKFFDHACTLKRGLKHKL
jgi:hypothetical protein